MLCTVPEMLEQCNFFSDCVCLEQQIPSNMVDCIPFNPLIMDDSATVAAFNPMESRREDFKGFEKNVTIKRIKWFSEAVKFKKQNESLYTRTNVGYGKLFAAYS